ncbi:MAG: ABC transporter ATP-binding protein [Acidimicrobiia bacterium]
MAPVIEVVDLHKSFGDVHAVRGISFSVESGECVAVLGPNGAGKTTTIEMLEGFGPPDAGTVRVLGTDPTTGGAALRGRLGIVLQECGIDPYLSVAEVLRQHASYYEHPRGVDDVIELVGLTEKRQSRVKTLSGGQQRRLDVGLGIIGDPELLFLDEPTTGFDPSARRQAWDLVHRLRDLGTTVLLTTHYMDEAQSLADRVIVIAAGQILAEGTPESIGGRATAKTRIQFPWPEARDLNELPVPAARDAGDAVIETDAVIATLHTLTEWAIAQHLDLDGLTVTQPSLEDIYLQLTADVGADAHDAGDHA